MPDLLDAVCTAMVGGGDHRTGAVDAFTNWLAAHPGEPSEEALLTNSIVAAIETDPSLRTVNDVAREFHLTDRTLQRFARKYVGVPPLALIRRRRLQEAAERVRAEPHVPLSSIAHDLGYADHAHLIADVGTVLGTRPARTAAPAGECTVLITGCFGIEKHRPTSRLRRDPTTSRKTPR